MPHRYERFTTGFFAGRRAAGRTTRKSPAVAVLAIVLMAGVLASCGSGSGTKSQAAPQNKDVLTIASTFPPLSLDPARSGGDNPLLWFIEPAYSPLIYRGAKGYLPGLAVSWGFVGSSNKIFDLKLRAGVKFSDGAELTAGAVKKWLSYVPKAGGPFAASYDFKAVDVTGPLSLRITLKKPDPSLPVALSHHKTAGHVASPEALKKPKELGTRTFGAGPYMLDPEQTTTNQQYTYVPNPHYWDKPSVRWKKVVIKVMDDENATILAMRSGNVDLMIGSPSTAASAEKAGFNVVRQPTIPALVAFLDRKGSNTPALRDVRVRQALNYALDRKAIAKVLSGGSGKPSSQPAVPGTEGYSADLAGYYSYDVAKAKRLLADAGYEEGFRLPLHAFDAGAGWTESAQIIASYWAKIGVKVDVKVPAAVNEWVAAVSGGKVSAGIWLGKNDDMYSYTVERLEGFLNPQRVHDAEADKLLAQAAAASDEQRPAIWKKVQERWLELAWFVPFSVEDTIYYARPGLKGVKDQMDSSRWVVYPNLQYFHAD